MSEIQYPTVIMSGKETILDKAVQATSERLESYGHPLDMYEYCARLWTEYLAHNFLWRDNKRPWPDLRAEDVARMMILFKEARLSTAGIDHWDSLTDIAGYARVIEMVQEERDRRANGVSN